MHQLAMIMYLVVSVDANSVPRMHCAFPQTDLDLLEQLLCVSESIRMTAEELADGEVAAYTERRLALNEGSTQKPRTAEEILQVAGEILRDAKKAVEIERERRKALAPRR